MPNLLFITLVLAFFCMMGCSRSNNKFKFELYDGYIIVNARLNDSIEGRFLLDTGADASVVIPEVAEKLKVKVIRYHEGGIAGGKKIKVPLSSLKSISIGQYNTSLSPIAIVDVNKEKEPYGKIAGIIGSDFLKHFVVTIDYKEKMLIFENRLSLTKRIKSGIKVPLKLVENTAPYLKIIINDSVKAEYKFDTGAGMTFLRLNDLYSIGLKEDTPGVEKITSRTLGVEYITLKAKIPSFSVGAGLEVKNLPVKAYDSEVGFIGANYLSNFAVTLNYREKYIVFKRN